MIFSFEMFPLKENLAISFALIAIAFFIGICSFFWLETIVGSIFCTVIYIVGLWDFFVKTEYRFFDDRIEKKSLFTSRFSLDLYKRLEIYPNGIYFLRGKNTYLNRMRGVFIPVRNWDNIAEDKFNCFLDKIGEKLEIVRINPESGTK
ncbi:hypothetical protein KAJ27_12235 [bacterium]|nr:hypothetical protein [bacterium]